MTGTLTTSTVYVAVAEVDAPFEATTLNVNEPGMVGVPEISPDAPSSTRPDGRSPEPIAKVGAGDPLAVTENEYAVPAVAGLVGLSDVMTGTVAITVVYALATEEPDELVATIE